MGGIASGARGSDRLWWVVIAVRFLYKYLPAVFFRPTRTVGAFSNFSTRFAGFPVATLPASELPYKQYLICKPGGGRRAKMLATQSPAGTAGLGADWIAFGANWRRSFAGAERLRAKDGQLARRSVRRRGKPAGEIPMDKLGERRDPPRMLVQAGDQAELFPPGAEEGLAALV